MGAERQWSVKGDSLSGIDLLISVTDAGARISACHGRVQGRDAAISSRTVTDPSDTTTAASERIHRANQSLNALSRMITDIRSDLEAAHASQQQIEAEHRRAVQETAHARRTMSDMQRSVKDTLAAKEDQVQSMAQKLKDAEASLREERHQRVVAEAKVSALERSLGEARDALNDGTSQSPATGSATAAAADAPVSAWLRRRLDGVLPPHRRYDPRITSQAGFADAIVEGIEYRAMALFSSERASAEDEHSEGGDSQDGHHSGDGGKEGTGS